MESELQCWKCGAPLVEVPLPLSRLAECATCRTDLHVCRMCRWYDTRVAKQCREPIAEAVQDKQRANFCDYFEARPQAHVASAQSAGVSSESNSAAERARSELEKLFGKETDK